MIRPSLIVCAAAVGVLAACAISEQKRADSEPYKEPVYRTGSKLPSGRAIGEPAQDAQRKTAEDGQNRPGPSSVKSN